MLASGPSQGMGAQVVSGKAGYVQVRMSDGPEAGRLVNVRQSMLTARCDEAAGGCAPLGSGNGLALPGASGGADPVMVWAAPPAAAAEEAAPGFAAVSAVVTDVSAVATDVSAVSAEQRVDDTVAVVLD